MVTLATRLTPNQRGVVEPPAIILYDTKYAHNVGAIIRAASCFGIKSVIYTGKRVQMDMEGRNRLPREERMKGYAEVDLINSDYPFDLLAEGAIPVAVELSETAENLADFEHDPKMVYVFGPEDGGIPQVFRKFCHRFVVIPSRHCFNLSVAVAITLYDRMIKLRNQGLTELVSLSEDRGFIETDLNIFEEEK